MSKNEKKLMVRHVLMFSGVLVVAIVAGWFYITGGRYEGTDNAYIKAAKVLITPEVTGRIETVLVGDNQKVSAGDILAVVDKRRYQIALDKANADLVSVARNIEQLKASYLEKVESISRNKVETHFLEKEYNRRLKLKNSISETELDDYRQRLDTSRKDGEILEAELAQITAQLGGDDTIETTEHPAYKAAEAELADAKLNLEHTDIKAPIDGYINTAPRLGDFARADAPLFTMIGTDDVWIEANFKETQLARMKIGQPVSIEVDAYPGQTFKGHVQSISPGTGSEFSILPAQNATGNWVKIVQRVSVRIAIDDTPDVPLRTGMSGYAEVDTKS